MQSFVQSSDEGLRHTNDGDIVLGSLELPEGNVDSDTTLTLGLQLVQNPGVLEGTLAKLGGCIDGKVSMVFDAIFQNVVWKKGDEIDGGRSGGME